MHRMAQDAIGYLMLEMEYGLQCVIQKLLYNITIINIQLHYYRYYINR